MKNFKLAFFLFGLSIVIAVPAFSQCETWHHLPNNEKFENSFVLYRDFLRKGNFKEAYPLWKLVYNNAPAADGKRSFVYSDGRTLLYDKFKSTKKKKEKIAIANFIFQLIEEQKKCYPAVKITNPPKELDRFRSAIK